MPVKFKTIAKGQPGVSGGGEKKYYASPVMEVGKKLEDLLQAIEKISTINSQ